MSGLVNRDKYHYGGNETACTHQNGYEYLLHSCGCKFVDIFWESGICDSNRYQSSDCKSRKASDGKSCNHLQYLFK